MPLTATQKAYRQQPAERQKRIEFFRAYRQRPEVKAREAERARKRRSTTKGAANNRARVKADRKKLGSAYIGMLLSDQTGIPQSEIAPEFIELKREQILLRRTAVAMETAAQHERKANEDISNND